MNIRDNIIFHDKLKAYFSGDFSLLDESVNQGLPIKIYDDYKNEQLVLKFENVKFRANHGTGWYVHVLGVVDDKIINITNKTISYFGIISRSCGWQKNEIIRTYNDLKHIDEYVDEEVFQFFDCFPYAPVHNLDDTYNLLYQYKKNKLSCKLLVLKTDNFYYNQTLDSLKKYFGLEYFYISPNKSYCFKNFYCTRPYHWIQDEALAFIKKEYIQKICEDFSGCPTHENVSIIKVVHHFNCSTLDTFQMTDGYRDLMQKKNIFDLNQLLDDLEHKIYIINNAKYIITNYLSPFNINIHKHCLCTNDKNFVIMNGGQVSSCLDQFKVIGDSEYDYYGVLIKGKIVDHKISLDEIGNYITCN